MGASMNSGGGGGRASRRARGRRHAPMAEINVTPMVDVMLVLLIIFMVAAPMLTTGVPVQLPRAKGKVTEASKDKPLVVTITKTGKVHLGKEDQVSLTLPELGVRMKAIAQVPGKTDEPVYISGDAGAEHGIVTRVMAEIREAGFRQMSIVIEVEQGG
jgi:biopolymer transport protein TolR